jgi:hypothetical protein
MYVFTVGFLGVSVRRFAVWFGKREEVVTIALPA